MKKRSLLGLALFWAGHMAWAAASPAGTWQSYDENHQKKALVAITVAADGSVSGKIARLLQKPGALCKACRGAKKDKPIEGMTVIWGLKPDGALTWSDGKVLDPSNGKIYRLTMTLSPDGKALHLRGYIGLPLFGRSQTWHRYP